MSHASFRLAQAEASRAYSTGCRVDGVLHHVGLGDGRLHRDVAIEKAFRRDNDIHLAGFLDIAEGVHQLRVVGRHLPVFRDRS